MNLSRTKEISIETRNKEKDGSYSFWQSIISLKLTISRKSCRFSETVKRFVIEKTRVLENENRNLHEVRLIKTADDFD